jgi:hypothetical protein
MAVVLMVVSPSRLVIDAVVQFSSLTALVVGPAAVVAGGVSRRRGGR